MSVRFSELGIKAIDKGFTGDKIKMNKVLNREISVEAFKIVQSKFEGKGPCLHLQISLKEEKHVIFTGSTILLEQIQQVPKDKFPFVSIIVENNDRYSFT